MTTCIKCGREIPDGELFCPACSLNPGAEGAPAKHPLPAQPGRMQQPVRQQSAPRPAPAKTEPEPQPKRTGRVPLVIASLLAVLGIGLAVWQFATLETQRRRLRLREEGLAEREKQLVSMQTEIDELTAALAEAEDASAAQTLEIEDLTASLNRVERSVSQSQYDLTEQQKTLEEANADNETLTSQVTALEQANEKLEKDYGALQKQSAAQSEQIRFFDSYVVFVEDDGTGRYHKYACAGFLKKNFWAYSRKLAEKQGYTPCPVCFGS